MEVPEPSGLHPHTHRAASEASGLGAVSSGEDLRARGLQGRGCCEREREEAAHSAAFLPVSFLYPPHLALAPAQLWLDNRW